ncbi:DUF4265 domain-containing protein [Streptomyces niveus]|uniref:DUF4265 domain-containing protein n=1 Tax=Streptomyces niveus TaxID=193462 RepID=UPI00369D9C72
MQFVVHEQPVGRTTTNYIARVDLAPFGLGGQVEQLWLSTADDGSHEVACIPFSAYGMARGDVVLLNEDDYVIEVIRHASHRTLRLLLTPDLPPADLQKAADEIKTGIIAAGLLSEWNGARLVAVDVPPDAEAPRSSPSWRQRSTPATPSGSGPTQGRSPDPRSSAPPELTNPRRFPRGRTRPGAGRTDGKGRHLLRRTTGAGGSVSPPTWKAPHLTTRAPQAHRSLPGTRGDLPSDTR